MIEMRDLIFVNQHKWALKIVAKIVLSRLPIPYAWWQTIGMFRHGRMDHAEYALKIFHLHSTRAYPHGLPPGAVVLELGPGDSIASAIIAAAHGTSQVWLVDAGAFARRDVHFYKKLSLDLLRHGLPVPDLSSATSFDDILGACNARYLTGGLRSLRGIPVGTVDFVWSHSVLEHVRKREVADTMYELFRCMKPGGYASHNIDFQDHLSGALNNLRFSEPWWESNLLAESGFYTNRIPALVMHEMLQMTGFELIQEQFGHWPSLPTPRRAISADFALYSDQDLISRTSHILLRRSG
jgi:hypothetical protein